MRKKEEKQLQRVSFRRLVFQALPEMWSFQFLGVIILGIPTSLLVRLMNIVAGIGGDPVTTANYRAILLSWRTPVLLVLGLLLVLVYIVLEIFAKIYLCDDILSGRKASIIQEIKKGIQALRLFCSPTGILVLLYIFIAVPLCGVGFSISLTRRFYIPGFIMNIILANPIYEIGYVIGILLLLWLGYRYVFVLHEVLIDGKTPAEGRRASAGIMKAHGKEFILGIIKVFVILGLIQMAAYILLNSIPEIWLESIGEKIPDIQVPDLYLNEGVKVPGNVVIYRILCSFTVLVGSYLISIIMLLCDAYFILRFTRVYLRYTRREPSDWMERPKKARYRSKVLGMFGVFALVFIVSVAAGYMFDSFFVANKTVRIIAERAGGNLASENSLEGLQAAIDHGCFGSKIDVQRTKDDYYIIQHDDSFQRLTEVAKKPQEMTLSEIRQLRIKDTTGSGKMLSVATLEEMLDGIKGKEKLFIELRGVTADQQMVDDIVRIVREKGCEDEIVLVSLKYDVINYAETEYPEFETGTLFFAGIGDVSRLNCDLLIMEEEFASARRVNQIHDAGKQAIVWTVNSEKGLYHFLDSSIDGVITDEVELAERVQKELDERTDLRLLQDRLSVIFSR